MRARRTSGYARAVRATTRRTRGPEAWVCAAVLLAAAPSAAETLSDIPASFVDIGVGADAAGRGGAVIASARGAASLFWNPAGLLCDTRGREIVASYCDLMGLVGYSAVAASVPLGDARALGAGIIYSGDEAMTEATAVLGASGRFAMPFLPPSRPLEAGAAVRLRRASFGRDGSDGGVSGSAIGFGIDLGVVVPLGEALALGAAGHDVIGALSWDTSQRGRYGEPVAPGLIVGAAVRPRPGLLFEANLDKALHLDNDDVISAGIEGTAFGIAALRGGYRRGLADSDREEYSVGAGAAVPAGEATVRVDVAYVMGRLANTLRLSVGYAF